MTPELLKIPIAIQMALAGGYLAYVIAYAGIRQHHTATDAAFRSLVFSLASTAVLAWKPFVPYVNECAAVISALLLGVAWRWFGMALCQGALRKMRVSWSDDVPNAWLTITAFHTDIRPSQIAVDIEGGRLLLCDDTSRFADAPFSPLVYGLDGSIAMYVTSEQRSDGTWIDHENVRDPIYGDRLTYIPATVIKRVEIRHWTKANEKAARAVAQDLVSAAAEAEPADAPNQECT